MEIDPRWVADRRRNSIPGTVLFMLYAAAFSHAQVITTIAGTGTATFSGDGGSASKAGLNSPYGLAVDNAGNVYIADSGNNRIRKINSAGFITTVAGCGNATTACVQVGLGDGGPATAPATMNPWDVAADNAGNFYFTDSGNMRVRKVDASGNISTVAGGGANNPGDGGPAINAQLANPVGLAIDSSGNLYFTDMGTNRVRKVSTSGIITTIAGNGGKGFSGDGLQATSATLNGPRGVTVDSAGNIYIVDALNVRVRKVNTAGIISTVAGNGQAGATQEVVAATNTSLNTPWSVKADGAGNIYISDLQNIRVYKVNPSGIIATFAGTGTAGFSGDGGPATSAQFDGPTGLAMDAAGSLYISDTVGNRLRKVEPGAALPPTISGIVNGASFQPGMVAGSFATIQGANLASVVDTWANSIVNGKLPTALDGVSVNIGTQLADLSYVSPTQINLIVPDVGPGPTQVTVTTSAGTSAPFAATTTTYGPAFFTWPNSQAVATRQDFSFAAKSGTIAGAASVAAKPGDVIILWGTGFGPTIPSAPASVQIPTSQTYSTGTLPFVTVNGITATVYGAALAPGFAGLYQVAIQVPSGLADGDWYVQATIGGVQSPSGVILSVQH
jgi:uncharacterized protein (TIGR03437 family)